MSDLGKAFVQIVPSAEGIKGSVTKVLDPEAKNAGSSAGKLISGNIKKLIAAAGIGAAVTKSLQIGGDLQQSFGGLDTLYGDAADAAKAYAQEAYKAGISANTYAEQAVSFGASLKAAYSGDTTKAMQAANTAIMDMADNAAKMGTPIEQVQSAYQGFAKGQYMLLDNLKLGYGGTKTEMERLLKDAQAISGVEYNIDNLGDVYDWKTGEQIAGLLSEDRKSMRSTSEYMKQSVAAVENKFTGNTTLAVIITNAKFNKTQLCKIAGMGHDGMARAIRPVHTSADGDSIYALSVGKVEADQDLVGLLAAEVISEAIIRAVENAESAYGYPSAAELK